MITIEQVSVYREFNGDDDGYSRAGCPGGTGMDWGAIRNLLQELTMLKRNLVSPEYGGQIRQRLLEMTDDENTAKALFEMA
ncbi:MAG TPA: hypothetical protein VG347_10290 [Verrucomicrobiae bacterium]|nr:hypothetical protein [Verrucomicrobiae bacterium]